MTYEAIIKEAINDQVTVKDEEITSSSTFNDFGLDSLDAVEVMMYIEEKLEISIPDDIYKSDMTLEIFDQELVRLVGEKTT